MIFASAENQNHTHRVSDGVESAYFSWPSDMDADEVLQQYADGYDHNDSDEPVEITIYLLDDNSVVFSGTIEP